MKRLILLFLKLFRNTFLLFAIFLLFCAHNPKAVEHGIFAPSRLDTVIGQDGVCSIQFSDEVTLWTFADTITGKWKSDMGRIAGDKNEALMDGMLSNSIAWSDRITAGNFKDIKLNFYKENGRPAQFIKHNKNENPLKHRFWALDGFRSGSRVYVYYLHVYVPDHTKFLDFEVLYSGLARWDIPRGWKPGDPVNFRRLGPIFGKGVPYYGAAVMERNGYVYLAGHFKKSNLEFPLSIARVKIEDIENSKAYNFLSHKGEWAGEIQNAGHFIGDVSGECSLSYNDYLKEYVIIYSQVFTGHVSMVRFKDFQKLHAAGKNVVLKVEKSAPTAMWPYSGKEIFSSGRSIYLIYIDPQRYQPLLVELKY
jgi:hypothetical protein